MNQSSQNIYKRRKCIFIISYITIMIMALFGIIRIFNPYIPFAYNISDLLWVYSATLLLFMIVFKKKRYYIIYLIPYIAAITDELMQKYWAYYPRPEMHIMTFIYTGTFDVLDLIAYTMGFILAILTAILIIKKTNSDII